MSQKTTIAINGFGRIGRAVYKIINNNEFANLEIKAINDLAGKQTLEHLLKFDSVYGKCDLNLDQVEFSQEPDPSKLKWNNIDIIIECTGQFTSLEKAKAHQGKKVIISAPCKDNTPHFVYNINHKNYNNQKIISAGSCTTVALSNIVKTLNDNFTIKNALATTIHSYTSTQRLVDAPHKDLRRARAAALSMIPTTTGAAIAVEKVLPQLKNKLNAVAVRVPTPIVSLIDLVAQIEKPSGEEQINNCFANIAKDKLVSTDYAQDPRAFILEPEFTRSCGNLIKVLAWYDNEYGYSFQLVKLVNYIAQL